MDQPNKQARRPSRKAAVAARGKQRLSISAAPAADVPEKRRRGRPSLKATGDAAAAGAVTKEKRRPGRPRNSDTSTAGGVVVDRQTAVSSPAGTPASAGTKRKRGRPKGAAARPPTVAAAAVSEADDASAHRIKRRRKSAQAREDEQVDRRSELEHASGESDESDESDDSARHGNDGALLFYGQLAPRMHMVSMATMKRKWAPLERDAVAAVQALLADCARPVLARLRAGPGGGGAANEQRQEQARQAIAGVTRRLRSKLVKGIPFPPPTVAIGGGASKKRRASAVASAVTVVDDSTAGSGDSGVAADFNFERAVEGIQALERQLTPLQHAVALLGREQAREEEALEADYAALRKLQTNAHAESRTWRERARRSHPLLPDDEGGDNDDDGDDGGDEWETSLELVKRPATPEVEDAAFEDLDKEMVAVAMQLGSHLESLRGNLQQIEGVVPAMARSQAALLQVLRTHLEPQQFEQILLG